MSIAEINSYNKILPSSIEGSGSDEPVSLADRVSAEQPEVAAVSAQTSDSITEEHLNDIYEWMMANKITMEENPKKMVDDILGKIRACREEDGSQSYRSYDEIMIFCALLQGKSEDLGTPNEEFFDRLNVTLFGLKVCFDTMINDIFVRPSATYDEPFKLD